MKKSRLADVILNKLVISKQSPRLISFLAAEARTNHENTLAVLEEMKNIHPEWYIIQRRCKTDIEVRLNSRHSSEIKAFLNDGGYTQRFAHRFSKSPNERAFVTGGNERREGKLRWVPLAAVLVSVLFVLLTWYILSHGIVAPAAITR